MKSTDVNLNKLQNQQSQSDDPEPTKIQNTQQLLIILTSTVAKKYRLDQDMSKTLVKNKFNKIKELSLLNPDKVIRCYNIYPLSDENIYKYLIENEK